MAPKFDLPKLPKALAQLRDESTPSGELIRLIDRLEGKYAQPEGFPGLNPTLLAGQDKPHFKKFVAAGGISALAHVARTGWPADGNLAASVHPYDRVTDIGHNLLEWEYEPNIMTSSYGQPRPGPKWRSPRRMAIICLADMGHYKPYLDELERVGFFAADALPAMLEATLPHIDYSLHNNDYQWFHVKDQTQTAVVYLINLAASAVAISRVFMSISRRHTGMAVCRLYKNPYQIWVDKCHAAREEIAARQRAKGWSEDRMNKAIRELKQLQQRQEDSFSWGGKHFFESGGLDSNVVRFFRGLIHFCNEDELLQLIHQGGLITLLKGCLDKRNPNGNREGPAALIDTLTALWTKKAAEVSRELYKCIEAEESQSLLLRQQGNEAFKAGQHQQALDLYWQAVSHNPEDYALFNNISLAALKTGDLHQALYAAEESLAVVPTVYKSWVRYGDALKAVQRWQLAHLAYSCARELAPASEDVQARQQEARSYLADVWDIDSVPPFGQSDPIDVRYENMMTAFKFMGMEQHDPQELVSMVMGPAEEKLKAMNILGKYDSQSRYWACHRMKEDMDAARAMAVATGLLRVSALPRSCAGLKRPEQLQQVPGQWMISWTDWNMQHPKSGLIRHMLTVTSSTQGITLATLMTLGTPGLHAVRRVLMKAMLTPQDSPPYRPTELVVAHRMFPLVDKISEMCRPWGIQIAAETATEAAQTCKNQDTHPEGYNNEGRYEVEEDTHPLLLGKGEDPNNGHKKR